MYTQIHTQVRKHVYARTHTHIHIHIHIYIHIHVHIHIHTRTYTCTQPHTQIHAQMIGIYNSNKITFRIFRFIFIINADTDRINSTTDAYSHNGDATIMNDGTKNQTQ